MTTNRDLTIVEVAQITGAHPESLRRLARLGRLRGAYRLGGMWLVRRDAFDAMRKGESRTDCAGAVR